LAVFDLAARGEATAQPRVGRQCAVIALEEAPAQQLGTRPCHPPNTGVALCAANGAGRGLTVGQLRLDSATSCFLGVMGKGAKIVSNAPRKGWQSR